MGGIPLDTALDPSASGTWVYVGVVPEPGATTLAALGVAVLFARRIPEKPLIFADYLLSVSRGKAAQHQGSH